MEKVKKLTTPVILIELVETGTQFPCDNWDYTSKPSKYVKTHTEMKHSHDT